MVTVLCVLFFLVCLSLCLYAFAHSKKEDMAKRDQYQRDLAQWKKDNNLPMDAEMPHLPMRNPGESAENFAGRTKAYLKEMTLWKTAPRYEQHLLSDDTAQGQDNADPNSMEAKNEKLNAILVTICILYIVRHVIHIVTEGMKLMTSESMVFNGVKINIVSHTAAAYNMIVSVVFIALIVLILRKKKWAVVSFFVFQMMNAIGICAILGNFADIGVHVFASAVCCLILSLLLLLRNDGKSGWKTIFKGSTPAQEKHESQPNPSPKEDVETSKETNLPKPKSHGNNRKKFLLCVFLCVLAVALLAAFLGHHAYDTPERRYAQADTLFSHGHIKESLDAFKDLADHDNYSPAKTKLGILYLTNDSVPMDSVMGFKYLEETAITDSTALEYLMYLYVGKIFKEIGHKNIAKANKYAQLALRQKKCIGVANLVMGIINADDKKYELAYYYFTEAAKYKTPMANSYLGWLYFNGYGCEANDKKAKLYFEKELSIGEEMNALFFLGMMYKEGYGVSIDTHKAIKYLRASAKLGNDDAKEQLAKMKIKGAYNEDVFSIWDK